MRSSEQPITKNVETVPIEELFGAQLPDGKNVRITIIIFVIDNANYNKKTYLLTIYIACC